MKWLKEATSNSWAIILLVTLAFLLDTTGVFKNILPGSISGPPTLLLVIYILGLSSGFRLLASRPLNKVLTIAILTLIYFGWFIINAALTDGDPYRPSLIFGLCLIQSYRILRAESFLFRTSHGDDRRTLTKLVVKTSYLRLLAKCVMAGSTIAIVLVTMAWQLNLIITDLVFAPTDEAGFEECMEPVGILMEDGTRLIFPEDIEAERECQARFGEQIRVPLFQGNLLEFFSEYLNESLASWAAITFTVVLFANSVKVYLLADHLGWRRLSLLVSAMLAVFICLIWGVGERMDGMELLVGVALASPFLTAILLIGLIKLRVIFVWIKSGFENPNT